MLARPLASLRAADVAVAGGKGANLGELIVAGFAVPEGFVLTTDAYRAAARAAGIDPADPASAKERLRASPLPPEVDQAAREAYRALGGGPVAVRSSATAEDLPGASFAGQQDTILNVDGEEVLGDAIRRCWASLWNERAVAYRAALAVDPNTVALAVVVQRMVDAATAGVLFTAEPVTGTRGRAAIDAITGLGEALVSGAVDPDHFVADPATGAVLERHAMGPPSLADDEIVALARLGARVEKHFGLPQDIEFALDRARRIWLVQSRPITTLFPLPPNAPDPATDLRVYLSFNVAQGVLQPLTPMGLQAFRLMASSIAAATGHPLRDRVAGPALIVDLAMRLYLDVTSVIRHPIGRIALQRASEVVEARSAVVFAALLGDPRLALHPTSRAGALARIAAAIIRTRVPLFIARAIARPDASRVRYLAELPELARIDLPPDASPEMQLDAFERLLAEAPRRLMPRLIGLVGTAMVSLVVARRLLRGHAREDELQTLLRGLPHNPTTEMDLALWALASRLREDAPSLEALTTRTPAELASAYRAGALPAPAQTGFAAFLATYGHRAIAEIDLGLPRWSEEPAHLLGAMANYVRLGDDALAPDALFARGAREADAMVATLVSRLHGPRRLAARFFLRRVRALMGAREQPKNKIIQLLFGRGRSLLQAVGAELAAQHRITEPGDIFFLDLPEARRAAAGLDVHRLVAERRATYRREVARRHIPRVLLSDGTDAEAALVVVALGDLRGTPASPGTLTAPARVILSPEGARLEPGEILVAPSTDPGWTPLFLTAGALVMEMGGMMSHGAVVAREYGIPAVVGVAGATERIATGQIVSVDGAAGVVAVEGSSG